MIATFKFFTPIAMFYTAVALADLVLVYRMTTFCSLTITAGIYIMPVYYFLEDMIAELYGYERARQVIWSVQVSALIFSIIISLADQLPTPSNWQHAAAYTTVFAHVFRTILGGGLVAMLGGAFFNSYILSKWKILVQGRFFFVRSVGSCALGQLFQTTAGCFTLYLTILPFKMILKILLPLYFIQLIGCIIIAIPGSFLVAYIKRLEGFEIYDYGISYNPFKFGLTNQKNEGMDLVKTK